MLLWRVVRKKMSLIRNFAQISCAASTPLARFYVPLSLFCTRGPGRFFNSALYWFWCFILHLALPGGQRGLRFAPPPLSAGPFGAVFRFAATRGRPCLQSAFLAARPFVLPHPCAGALQGSHGAGGSAGPCGVAFQGDNRHVFTGPYVFTGLYAGFPRPRAGKQCPFAKAES